MTPFMISKFYNTIGIKSELSFYDHLFIDLRFLPAHTLKNMRNRRGIRYTQTALLKDKNGGSLFHSCTGVAKMKSFPDWENKVYKSRFFFYMKKLGKKFEDEKVGYVIWPRPSNKQKMLNRRHIIRTFRSDVWRSAVLQYRSVSKKCSFPRMNFWKHNTNVRRQQTVVNEKRVLIMVNETANIRSELVQSAAE